MEMFAIAPNENSESLPQQWRAASSGWLVMWWFKLHSCDDEVETVAEERPKRLQKSPNLRSTSRMGPSRDLRKKTQNSNLIEPLPVAVPPRDFWSSTYCPPQSATMWTRVVSWGSTNPEKGCLKATNIFEVFNMVKVWILYSTNLHQSSKRLVSQTWLIITTCGLVGSSGYTLPWTDYINGYSITEYNDAQIIPTGEPNVIWIDLECYRESPALTLNSHTIRNLH